MINQNKTDLLGTDNPKGKIKYKYNPAVYKKILYHDQHAFIPRKPS